MVTQKQRYILDLKNGTQPGQDSQHLSVSQLSKMATLTSSTEKLALASSQTINYPHIEMPPFDPAIHLAFQPPTKRHSFTSLNLLKPTTAPDMCVTEPFQLFSDEGIRMIRRDLLRKEVLDKHLTAWERAPCTIAGAEEVRFFCLMSNLDG